jgi:hypothetical protein
MAWQITDQSADRTAGRWCLYYGDDRSPVAAIVPDDRYPGMYRVAWPARAGLSEIVSLRDAKEAAARIAERGPPRRDPGLFRWKLEAAGGPKK